MSPAKKLQDNVSRVKASSPLGRSTFIGLRSLDGFWQHALIYRGWGVQLINRLGGTVGSTKSVFNAANGELSLYHQLIVAMAFGSGIKQTIHMSYISEQELSAGSGIAISFFNTLFNSVNTLLALWSVTSQEPALKSWFGLLSQPQVAVGVSLYTIGILTELISELQRKSFKKDPANNNKPYGAKLFGLATNINYGAYTLWRSGFALACGGWVWGLCTFSFFFWDFATRGVPVLDQYCTKRVCPCPSLSNRSVADTFTPTYSMASPGRISKHAFIIV